MFRRTILSAACAAALLATTASFALGGEITGTGKSLKPLHANSECAFSGLNDTPGEDGFGHTQSWGQLSKADKEFLTSIGFNPGVACNGHLHPMR